LAPSRANAAGAFLMGQTKHQPFNARRANMTHLQEILAELELIGIIKHDGNYRRDPETGQMQPTYILNPEISDDEIERLLLLLAENDNRPLQ
jgi:hypothetical protein